MARSFNQWLLPCHISVENRSFLIVQFISIFAKISLINGSSLTNTVTNLVQMLQWLVFNNIFFVRFLTLEMFKTFQWMAIRNERKNWPNSYQTESHPTVLLFLSLILLPKIVYPAILLTLVPKSCLNLFPKMHFQFH